MSGSKGYCSRRAYHRLDGYLPATNSSSSSSSSSFSSRRRRFWRVKTSPRLGFLRRAFISPKSVFVRIRDAYVGMMLQLASTGAFIGGGLGYCGEYGGFARPAVKEYHEKMIVDIYKSMIDKGHILAVKAPGGVDIVPAVTEGNIVGRR